MKKPSSMESRHTNTELKRYLGVLHEEHMSGLKAMGERFIDVNRKLDSHTEMIGGLAVRMTSMELKIANIELKTADIQMKLAATERNILILKDDVGFIKSGMRRKVDQEEFDALTLRVSMLEKRALK